jgi:hypothetical protein
VTLPRSVTFGAWHPQFAPARDPGTRICELGTPAAVRELRCLAPG